MHKKKISVDARYLLSFLIEENKDHEKAVALFHRIPTENLELHTTVMTIIELHYILSELLKNERYRREKIIKLLKSVQKIVIIQGEEMNNTFVITLELYERFPETSFMQAWIIAGAIESKAKDIATFNEVTKTIFQECVKG